MRAKARMLDALTRQTARIKTIGAHLLFGSLLLNPAPAQADILALIGALPTYDMKYTSFQPANQHRSQPPFLSLHPGNILILRLLERHQLGLLS